MQYLSYRPGPPLNEFVYYFWLIEGGQAARLEKILPCGTSELVVKLKHDEIDIHDPKQPERYRRFPGAVFSGTYSHSFICNALQHEAIMGVHFKPGGALPFLNAEASELANEHGSLGDLWGRSGLELHERLCSAVTHQQRFRIMETVLRGRLQYPTAHQVQMKMALKMFATGNGAPVKNVALALDMSQRRFIQMFSACVGLAPKAFCRIRRFQRARVLAAKFEAPDWAAVAVACGYFDQSHLIKDFKEFSGSTPRIGFAPKVMQFISAKLCVSAASALNVAAIMVNAESTETQSSQRRVKSYSKTLLGQGPREYTRCSNVIGMRS